MKYLYEAIVEPVGQFLEVRFPDLDLITQGDDLKDAAFMAQDLLESHIVRALQKGETLPDSTFGHDCPPEACRLAVVVDCDDQTPQEESMSVSEAADILDVSESRVRAMIRDGVLKSRKIGRVHRVSTRDVMRRFNEPVPAGRPRAASSHSSVAAAPAA